MASLQDLQQLFSRELNKLKNEISLYRNEQNLWMIAGDIKNSGGNLCLHLIGNLNTYIGDQIGGSGYIRDRDLEFSARDISREQLIESINNTIIAVHHALSKITESDLASEHPFLVWEEKTTIGFLLMHLAIHLGYHLGQINYHRRILDGESIPS